MTHLLAPDRWAQVTDLFAAAGALPPEARGEFLANRCGTDVALRAEVESLLAFDGPGATELTRRVHDMIADAGLALPERPKVLQMPRRPFVRRHWLPLAAAAVLAIAIAGTPMVSGPGSPSEPARTPQLATAPAAMPSAVLALALGTSRSASEPPALTLDRQTPALELRVRLHPDDRLDRYSMELRSSTDAVVWRADDLRATREPGDPTVVGLVPASSLDQGTYELMVRGAAKTLGYLTLTVHRQP